MGDRNHEDSARKSTSTRSGLARRKASGKPVGAVPLGFTVEHRPDSSSVRVIDPATRPTIELIFDLVEAGGTFGAVARALIEQGLTTKRGRSFDATKVRRIVRNDNFAGRTRR